MFMSLNPYSNGMKIELETTFGIPKEQICLNPYSNGMKIEHYLDQSLYE